MLKKIRLELARDHEFPEGSRRTGYEFTAPLDERGHIDAAEWHKQRDHCRVRRFRPGEADDVDMERIVQAAHERACAIEINAHPDRIDIDAVHCRIAKKAGIKIAIATDTPSWPELKKLFKRTA